MSGTVERGRETSVSRKCSLCPHGGHAPECVQGTPRGQIDRQCQVIAREDLPTQDNRERE